MEGGVDAYGAITSSPTPLELVQLLGNSETLKCFFLLLLAAHVTARYCPYNVTVAALVTSPPHVISVTPRGPDLLTCILDILRRQKSVEYLRFRVWMSVAVRM